MGSVFQLMEGLLATRVVWNVYYCSWIHAFCRILGMEVEVESSSCD